mgnify:CR=1 FL=1
MGKFIDVIIPRGGKSLVKKVQTLSNLPTIGHLEGICHTFVDKDANLKIARKIVYNAKLRNTAICGATETILLHCSFLSASRQSRQIFLQAKLCMAGEKLEIMRLQNHFF